MKNYKSHILFLTLMVLIINTDARNINSKAITFQNYGNEILTNIQEKDTPIVFLKGFFRWYKTRFDYLDNHIFPIATDYKNNSPYRINFNETEKYLSILKSSGFFSDHYINYYRAYYKKIDLTLQKTKQNDGNVEGLDYEPIVNSQEPEAMLENLNNIKLTVLKSTANGAIIKVLTPFDVDSYSLYHLTKTDGKYLIDKIDFLIGGKVQNWGVN